MPVDVKAILAAAEPKPVFGDDVMNLSRIAQSNRTYRRAQQLREEQEYNTLAIAQGAEIAGSVNFMDSIADIDLSIGALAKMSEDHKGNKLVQASLTKLRGGLEETKELAAGRNLAVEGLSELSDDIYQMHEERAKKDGIYNEAAVTDLIKSAKNYVNTNAHYLDQALRKDYTTKIDELVKTRNIYNMIDFYDTDVSTRKIDFQTKSDQPDYLTGIQQGLLQQAKNYADVGLVTDAAASLSSLAAVGVSEAKYTQRQGQNEFAFAQVSDYKSRMESIKQEVQAYRGFLGQGVESGAEMDLPTGFKEKIGGILVDLPSDPNRLAGPGGLETVNIAIGQSSKALDAVLGETKDNFWSMETLDNIAITSDEAAYLNLPEGASYTLDDVFKSYRATAAISEKEPYMDILAKYASDPEVGKKIATGFKSGEWVGASQKEMNAVKVMIGIAKTYNKLKMLRDEHSPFSVSWSHLQRQQLGGGGGVMGMVNWPGQQQP